MQGLESRIFEGIQQLDRNVMRHASEIVAFNHFTCRDRALTPRSMQTVSSSDLINPNSLVLPVNHSNIGQRLMQAWPALNSTNAVAETQPASETPDKFSSKNGSEHSSVSSEDTARNDMSDAASVASGWMSGREKRRTCSTRLKDNFKRDAAVKAEFYQIGHSLSAVVCRPRAGSISSFKREGLVGESVGEWHEMIDRERFPEIELGISFSALDLATFITLPVAPPFQRKFHGRDKVVLVSLPKAFTGFKRTLILSKRRVEELASAATTPLNVVPFLTMNSSSMRNGMKAFSSKQIVERQIFLLLALGKLTPSAFIGKLNGSTGFWVEDRDRILESQFATIVEMSGLQWKRRRGT